MLFRQSELLRWFGISVFEIWIWLLSLTVFSVLLVLKVEEVLSPSTSWFLVFSPLFVSDGINAYFCIIVFISTCTRNPTTLLSEHFGASLL